MTVEQLIEELQRLPKSAKTATVFLVYPDDPFLEEPDFEKHTEFELEYEHGEVWLRVDE